MSRTYRKSCITEEQTLTQYINRQIDYLKRRSFYYEYYLTEHGQKAYDKAMEEWNIAYHRYLYRIEYLFAPREPNIWEFKKARAVIKEIDYNKEINEATDEYNRFNRDGRFYEGDLNRSYRKHCAKELRRFNRELARKIIKEDESWEQKPYPDTYLGKKHIWDY